MRKGLLTRDARMVERKKYGRRGARRGSGKAQSGEACGDPNADGRQRGFLTGLMADVLAAVPEADRPATVKHLTALAKLGPRRLAAILTAPGHDGQE